MARRGENIYKRKDGRWEGRYVVGKNKNGTTAFAYIYGKTYKEVKHRLVICIADKKLYEKTRREEIKFRDGSVQAWLEYWLDEEIKPVVKFSTYAVYRSQLERHLLPVVGEEKLYQVGEHSMERVYHAALAKKVSAATALCICKRFLAALKSAREINLIQNLPQLPCKRRDGKKKPRFMSVNEQKLIEKRLDAGKPKDLAVLLALYSGSRVGECCGFKWNDFDPLAGGLYVTRTVQRAAVFDNKQCKTRLLIGEPKSEDSKRFIPLPGFMVQALDHYKKINSAGEKDFLLGVGEKAMEPRVLQYHIAKLTESLGLKGIHFHTLRHTFATRFIEKNGDIQALTEILGHSSAKITLDWYGHSTKQHMQKVMRKLNRLAG